MNLALKRETGGTKGAVLLSPKYGGRREIKTRGSNEVDKVDWRESRQVPGVCICMLLSPLLSLLPSSSVYKNISLPLHFSPVIAAQ